MSKEITAHISPTSMPEEPYYLSFICLILQNALYSVFEQTVFMRVFSPHFACLLLVIHYASILMRQQKICKVHYFDAIDVS